MILVAIVALGAGGLILIMLAIANPLIDDHASDFSAARDEGVSPRVTVGRDGVVHARSATEARGVIEQKPPRRSALRQRKRTSHANGLAYFRTRRWSVLDTSYAKYFTGIVACSVAVGLLIAHLSA